MEDPGTNLMMSFGKVPCTPVTSAYVNFYDIFGDVDRLGTGSSHGSSGGTSYTSSNCIINDEDEKESEKSVRNSALAKRKCSKCYKYNAYETNPYITFMQEKQVELLGALHEEIRCLKSENADLKFQVHVILQDHEDPISENIYRGKMVPSTPESYLGDLNANRLVKDKEKTLELELESAAKMIEELKWIKLHYEKQIRAQEVRIEDLERQLTHRQSNTNNNVTLLPINQITTCIPPALVHTTENVTPSRVMKSGRQRSTSISLQRELLSRRNSLQSLLPDDYKKAVATLPPIGGNGNPQLNGVIPFRVMTINTESPIKFDSSNGRNNKSSPTHTQNTVLGQIVRNNHGSNNNNSNNTPFVNEKTAQFGGESEFWYAK